MQELFRVIKSDYGVDLQDVKNCMAILDGEVVSIERPWEIWLEKRKQLWVMPMISGG